jgi:hypothetical protein
VGPYKNSDYSDYSDWSQPRPQLWSRSCDGRGKTQISLMVQSCVPGCLHRPHRVPGDTQLRGWPHQPFRCTPPVPVLIMVLGLWMHLEDDKMLSRRPPRRQSCPMHAIFTTLAGDGCGSLHSRAGQQHSQAHSARSQFRWISTLVRGCWRSAGCECHACIPATSA